MLTGPQNRSVPRLPAELTDALDRYLLGPSLVNEAVRDLDPGQLNRTNTDGWSIRDIVIHLADAELVRAVRIGLILAEDEPDLPTMDEQRWKRRLHYLWRSPEGALSLFAQTRYAMGEVLRQCDTSAWARAGIHPDTGRLTLIDLIARGIAHVDDHVAQVQAMRA